jgi:hypothetical protein
MTIPFDFTLLPVVRQQGFNQPDLPGLRAVTPARRVGRGRSQDYLVMQLTLQGNAPLSAKARMKLLDSLGQTYFKAGGSSTAAMRVVAESLNQSLFSRNQRGASRGMRSLGIFSLAVFRGQFLFLAQCGAAHALHVKSTGFQHFHDPSTIGRGLGMGRATPIQYNQSEISIGDLVLIAPILPPVWNQTLLSSLYDKPLKEIRAQLLKQTDADLEAVLIRVADGSGKINTLRPEMEDSQQDQGSLLTGDGLSQEDISYPEPVIRSENDVLSRSVDKGPLHPSEPVKPTPQIDSRPSATSASIAPPESKETPDSPKPSKPPKPKRKPIVGPALLAIAGAVGTTLRQFFKTVWEAIRRILPDEKMLDLPPSVMLFGALAVPLLIVSVASVVYLREGRGRMHQEKLAHAQSVAEQAIPLEEPVEVRAAWEEVLGYLDEAENYGSSEDSRQLRVYAYSVLDTLDLVERLDYQPGIVSGLPSGVTVKKMLVSPDNDLYLLNGENGYVLRATYTEQGYELDKVFNCGPVPQPLMVGPLIDIAVLPRGQEDGATLIGMDSNGNLLRCVPGEEQVPIVMQMAPPDLNWGEPNAFALDNGNIYVLDPKTNSVWIYWALNDYTELPTYYFGNQIPPLQSVIDMSVTDGDLYLLHDDGHITVCDYSSYVDAPTRCTDPAELSDLRAGYQNGIVMQGTDFDQLQFAPPPDPSIYLFDPEAEALYHLSMRLAFQRQYRPITPLGDEAVTAFAVGPNRQAFIATNEQVYVAIVP